MKFSVVVPVYNVQEYLEKCVSSILSQTCKDYELILVDDGSTDGSGALCDAIRAACGCRVIHQDNGGLGAARNTGIEAAQGEYMVFVDSDDYISPELLAGIEQAMEQHPADIYTFGFTTTDGEKDLGVFLDALPERTPVDLHTCPELLLALPNAWCRATKRELFLSSGIRFPSRVWYEDIRTTMKLFALAESIVYLPEPWYYYLQRDGSITRNGNLQRNREIIDAFEDLLGWYRREGLFETYYTQLERLCIDHVFLAASVRVLRIDPKSDLLRELREYVEKNFPNYSKNSLLAGLPPAKRLAYRLLRMKAFGLLRLLFRLKDGK